MDTTLTRSPESYIIFVKYTYTIYMYVSFLRNYITISIIQQRIESKYHMMTFRMPC